MNDMLLTGACDMHGQNATATVQEIILLMSCYSIDRGDRYAYPYAVLADRIPGVHSICSFSIATDQSLLSVQDELLKSPYAVQWH